MIIAHHVSKSTERQKVHKDDSTGPSRSASQMVVRKH